MRTLFRLLLIVLGITLLARVLWPTPQQFLGFAAFVKSLLRPTAIAFLTAFNDPMTPVLLSLAILCCAVLALFYLVLITERRIATVAELVKKLISLPPDTSTVPGLLAVQRCDAVTRVLQADRPIYVDWSAFKACFLRPTSITSVRPSDFITIRSLERRNIYMAVFGKMPQYFIALGLILTFMGLVAGLYYASAGMRSADLETARQSLIMLLNAATFKFTTSIAGLTSSLLLSVGYLRQRIRCENVCEDLCIAIEGALALPEKYSSDDPTGELIRATEQLEKLNSHLANCRFRTDVEGGNAIPNT